MATHVGLRLRHASNDLAGLAAGLGLPAARMWIAGDARKTPLGDPLPGTYQESYLALNISSSSETISGAIEVVRAAILAAPPDLRVLLADPALRKSLYCTLESNGEGIDLNALKTLVELGIELEIEGHWGAIGKAS